MPMKPNVEGFVWASRIPGNVKICQGNILRNESLNWSLKMLWVMCCYKKSMLLLAAGISIRMLNSRERKEV